VNPQSQAKAKPSSGERGDKRKKRDLHKDDDDDDVSSDDDAASSADDKAADSDFGKISFGFLLSFI
jgi:hypothetical protein